MVIPRFGVPVDVAQWGAAALGVATLAWGARFATIARRNERRAVAVLAVIAALLSWGYVAMYLRGGPRIIDATSYYLEARGLAEGHVSWPAGEAETAVLGRFLVRSEDAGGARAAVLFPPGYPMLLAIGFLAGAPLAVGPLLAAALVVATWALAKEMVRAAPELAGAPLCAAALSAVCGALRYHTADTMSHGLAALCFAAATALLWRARSIEAPRRRRALFAALAGLFGGWLFATRPASGLAWGATAIVMMIAGVRWSDWTRRRAAGKREAPGAFVVREGDSPARNESEPVGEKASIAGDRVRILAAAVLGAVPFVIVFVVHQRLATGRWLASSHAAHYALNDGPAGCFRYGFGEGIGCFGEHADFVRANLPHGFGFVAAVKTTARRLWMHLVDCGNAEPLALLVPAGAALAWRRPGVRALAAAIGLLIAAYAPFYFDGNYPGGGARLFADVLPFEHVLLAIAAVSIAARRAGPAAGERSGAWIVGLALVGFAVRAGFDHAQLRDRDGGAPLVSKADLAAQGVASGLLFADTDAAFDLAFDPDARASAGVETVRFKGDALDAFAWRERGAPPAFTLRFVAPADGGRGRAVVAPYVPVEAETPLIQGGSLWPPRAQEGGAYALPAFAGGTCASSARLLRVFAGAAPGGAVRAGVPAKMVAGRVLEIGVLAGPAPVASRGSSAAGPAETAVEAEIAVVADGVVVARASVAVPRDGAPSCSVAVRARVPEGARRVDVAVEPGWRGAPDPADQPLIALDRIDVLAAP